MVTLIMAALGGFLTWGLTFVFPSLPYGWRSVIAILAASGVGAAIMQPAEPSQKAAA